MATPQTPGTPAQPAPASAGADTGSSAWLDVWARAEKAAEAAPVDPGAASEAVEDAETEAPAEPTEPAKVAAKPDDEESDQPDRVVSWQEKAKWREQKIRDRKALQAEREKLEQRRVALEAELSSRYGKYAQAEAALEAGDYDAHAKALYGKSWNDHQKDVLRRFQSPEYQRIAKLEAEVKAERDRKAQEQQQAQQQAEQQRQAREQAEYLEAQAAELKEADVVAHPDDPHFMRAVFDKQQEYFDGRATISAAEAAELVVEDIRASATMRARYEFLSKVFGDQAALQPVGATRAPAPRAGSAPVKQGAKVPKAVSQRNAVEASPPGGAFNEQEWFRKHSAALRSSTLE